MQELGHIASTAHTDLILISSMIFLAIVLSKILSKKTSTVDVLWLIILGAVFSYFGLIPRENETLEFIGELGIVFIMFALGFDEDLRHFLGAIKRSWGIAIIGAIFPFCAGFFSFIYLSNNYEFIVNPAQPIHNQALLWGLTMTATAVSLTMMSLRNKRLHTSAAARGIMTAAVIDDILSLIGVAIIIPLALSQAGNGTHGDASLYVVVPAILIKVTLFFLIAIALRILIFHDKESQFLINKYPVLKKVFKRINFVFEKLGARNIFGSYKGEFAPLLLLTMAMFMGVVAKELGFHPAIGAYIAGLIIQKHHFYHWKHGHDRENEEVVYEKSKFVVDNIAFIIFGPIFFVTLGSKIHIDYDMLMRILPGVLILFSSVFVLQILSASLAARYTGSYNWKDSMMIGFGMLGRAELAFIVINIAFVQNSIISVEQFYILIFTSFLLNISVPLMISLWAPHYNKES